MQIITTAQLKNYISLKFLSTFSIGIIVHIIATAKGEGLCPFKFYIHL